MTVACFIGGAPDEVAFVNRVHQAFGVDLVVLEQGLSSWERLVRKYRALGLRGVVDAGYARLLDGRSERRPAVYDRWLGDSWRELSRDLSVLRVASVNDEQVVRSLADLGQVTLVVHAGSIVREDVLRTCEHTLNLHWGLSPYYRGTRCTEWALMHWDVRNIGVTVHELASDVDGGAVVGQARAQVGPTDTVHSINVQLTALGTDIVVSALIALRDGSELVPTPQDLSRGQVTYNRQWSAQLSKHVARLERRRLDLMLATPSRGELPIIELRRT